MNKNSPSRLNAEAFSSMVNVGVDTMVNNISHWLEDMLYTAAESGSHHIKYDICQILKATNMDFVDMRAAQTIISRIIEEYRARGFAVKTYNGLALKIYIDDYTPPTSMDTS